MSPTLLFALLAAAPIDAGSLVAQAAGADAPTVAVRTDQAGVRSSTRSPAPSLMRTASPVARTERGPTRAGHWST